MVLHRFQIFGKCGVACLARWGLPLGPVETVLRGDGTSDDDLRRSDGAQARDETSDHGDQAPLGVRAALHVALGGLQRGVAGKLLDVPKRSTGLLVLTWASERAFACFSWGTLGPP